MFKFLLKSISNKEVDRKLDKSWICDWCGSKNEEHEFECQDCNHERED